QLLDPEYSRKRKAHMNLFQKLRIVVFEPLILLGVFIKSCLILSWPVARAHGQQVTAEIPIPTGNMITPTAANGAIFQDLNPKAQTTPNIRTNQAVAISVSPDGRIVAILTSENNTSYRANGNVDPDLSSEYVFLFDITGTLPRQLQVVHIRNTFQGLA